MFVINYNSICIYQIYLVVLFHYLTKKNKSIMQELNYKAPKPFIYNNIRNKSSFLFDCCKSAIKLIGFQHNVRHSVGFFIEVDGKTTEYYVEFVIDGAMNVFQNDNEDCFNFQPSAIFISSLKDWLDSNIEVIQHSKAYEQVFNNHFNRL